MLSNFFRLNAPFEKMAENDIQEHLKVSRDLRSALYEPDQWLSDPKRLKGIFFSNVSLSKTEFSEVTFTECHFEDCLFIGAKFIHVEFHRCNFVNCNFYKASFDGCYIDPRSLSFDKKYHKSAANLGVDIYQGLYDNSVRSGQVDFARFADFEFRRWKRWQLAFDRKIGKIDGWDRWTKYAASLLYECVAGFGYKPLRFVLTTILLFTAVSCFNKYALSSALLVDGAKLTHLGWSDAVFYTYSTMTVLGFSTILPATSAAKLLAVTEALMGVGWLGIFTALLVKRFVR